MARSLTDPILGAVRLALWAILGYSLLLASVLGCSALPVYVEGGDVPPELEEGAALWGVELDVVDSPKGAIKATPLELGEKCIGEDGLEHDGCAHSDMCQPAVEAQPKAAHWAHEVGHVAGLEHVDAPDAAVMREIAGRDNTETTPRQRKAVRRLAARLQVCREADKL